MQPSADFRGRPQRAELRFVLQPSACQRPAWSGVTWISRKFSLPESEK